eukprot:TRINITY_DN539_c0_g1_i2.p1 TRINITY_DN539_c0_g1~~TRINITY_DN539_c0_g1_i2.p1  ORF type:complete len:137 (+),score=15.57 TRINITY_DN539_c0_g1_i2:32-412(+)
MVVKDCAGVLFNCPCDAELYGTLVERVAPLLPPAATDPAGLKAVGAVRAVHLSTHWESRMQGGECCDSWRVHRATRLQRPRRWKVAFSLKSISWHKHPCPRKSRSSSSLHTPSQGRYVLLHLQVTG